MISWRDTLDWAGDRVAVILAILAALIVVWQRTDDKTIVARILTLIGSAALAAATGADIAAWAGWPESVTYASVTVLGPLVLEVSAALIKDPKRLLDLYNQWRGK